jgi:hypothetical protein
MQKTRKTAKTQDSQNLRFLEKSVYSFFTKFAIVLKDSFFLIYVII